MWWIPCEIKKSSRRKFRNPEGTGGISVNVNEEETLATTWNASGDIASRGAALVHSNGGVKTADANEKGVVDRSVEANGGVVANSNAMPEGNDVAHDEDSPLKKKKKRTRKPKKNKGFDLTLPHGGVSLWAPVSGAPPLATKIPFKMGQSDAHTSQTQGRSHIVFGEGDDESFDSAGQDQQHDVEAAEEADNEKAPIPTEQTEETATEEEEEDVGEETEEVKKEKAIGGEDVNDWNPISAIPKEGDIVAFKVMEMDDHYCPQISDFKVGVVKGNGGGKDRLQIRLFNFTRRKSKGKFEMRLKKKGKKAEEAEEEGEKEEREELVTENQVRKTNPEMTIQWNSVIEPKLRPADPVPEPMA